MTQVADTLVSVHDSLLPLSNPDGLSEPACLPVAFSKILTPHWLNDLPWIHGLKWLSSLCFPTLFSWHDCIFCWVAFFRFPAMLLQAGTKWSFSFTDSKITSTAWNFIHAIGCFYQILFVLEPNHEPRRGGLQPEPHVRSTFTLSFRAILQALWYLEDGFFVQVTDPGQVPALLQ